jgi:hypothetical protein
MGEEMDNGQWTMDNLRRKKDGDWDFGTKKTKPLLEDLVSEN